MLQFGIATALLFFTILVGLPIAFAIGLTSIVYILITTPAFLNVIPLRMFAGVDSFILMAIPLFVFAAEIMIHSGISAKMFNLIKLLVGRYRGGLAYVNILASTVFGSISGAALSDIAGLGSIEMAAMRDDGYEENFAGAVTAMSSVQSPVIPPSNSAILYGGIMGLSVGALFVAGVVPGLLLAGSQFLYVFLVGKKMRLPKHEETYPRAEKIRILREGIVAILMPVIILGGILFGWFTPTEAAAVAVVYAVAVSFLVFRNGNLQAFRDGLWNAAKSAANLFMIIAFSSVFAWALGMHRIPDRIASFMLGLSDSLVVLTLLVNVLLVIIGMWMETGAAIILFAPILAPIMVKAGMHPVQFAMILLVNLAIGLVTPPVGVVLYAVASVGRLKFERLVRSSLPLIFIGFAVVAVISFVPEVSLFLPRLLGFI